MVLKGSSMYNSMGHSDKNLDLSKVLWQVNCELGLNHLSLKIQTNSPSPQEVYFAIPSGHQRSVSFPPEKTQGFAKFSLLLIHFLNKAI